LVEAISLLTVALQFFVGHRECVSPVIKVVFMAVGFFPHDEEFKISHLRRRAIAPIYRVSTRRQAW
jgi:hypothetical protein